MIVKGKTLPANEPMLPNFRYRQSKQAGLTVELEILNTNYENYYVAPGMSWVILFIVQTGGHTAFIIQQHF